MKSVINWIKISEKKPTLGEYCLIASTCGWIGLQKYRGEEEGWCASGFPDVVCDNIVYDVPNKDIIYYTPLNSITFEMDNNG